MQKQHVTHPQRRLAQFAPDIFPVPVQAQHLKPEVLEQTYVVAVGGTTNGHTVSLECVSSPLDRRSLT